MKKKITFENLENIKQVKLISSILLGLSEVENIEANLDENTIILELNENLNDAIIKYYINTTNLKIINIVELI